MLFWIYSYSIVGAEIAEDSTEAQEIFINDLVKAWKLLSPTVIFMKDEMPSLCLKTEKILCLTNDGNPSDLAIHLAKIHKERKQDGLIFVGNQVHEKLIKQVAQLVPSLFLCECPVFMPKSMQNRMNLRLDSNIIFYEEVNTKEYKLEDIFAVKGGQPITLELGKWKQDHGIELQLSMNRWGRRTDLNGAIFVNGLYSKGNWANFTRNEDGAIMGSVGYYQDMLFYILEGLNVTLITVEYKKEWGRKLLRNGTWQGPFGMLQRGEIDVDSVGIGINIPRTAILDFPIPLHKTVNTLIAAKPEGIAPNMWVYVRVFGLYQWSITLALLIVLAITISIISYIGEGELMNDTVGSNIALVSLYFLQMGSHPDGRWWATRLLTLTASFFAFLMFVYFCVDITAEMTSGPPSIPLKIFQDVIEYDYTVVVTSEYRTKMLSSSKPGSAPHRISQSYMEYEVNDFKAVDAIMEDQKKVFFSTASNALTSPAGKRYVGQLISLNLDDSFQSISTLPLLKGSEFLPLFNHYILKEHEHGIRKRIYYQHHMGMFTLEQFGMGEPQPLGATNTMFLFIWMAFGICFSIAISFAEWLKQKLFRKMESQVKQKDLLFIRTSQTVDKQPEMSGSRESK